MIRVFNVLSVLYSTQILFTETDPTTSGPNSEHFSMKDFLIPLMGNAFALKDYKDRTPEESTKWSKWCGRLKWYLAMLRVGYEPSFSCSGNDTHTEREKQDEIIDV